MKQILKLLKGSGWLNLLGMSVAFAAIYIILVQVNFDLGYNKSIKDVDRLYIVSFGENDQSGTNLPRPLGRALLDESSLVENYGISWASGLEGHETLVKIGAHEQEEVTLKTTEFTQSLFDVLGLQPVAGTFDKLKTERSVAINESTARHLHLELGDVLTTSQGDPFIIQAIYRDMPENCAAGRMELIHCAYFEKRCYDDENEWSFIHWIKLHHAEDVRLFEEQATATLRKYYQEIANANEGGTWQELKERIPHLHIKLIPVKDMYFHPDFEHRADSGNPKTTGVLALMAVLILFITLVNYINFFLAQVPTQLKMVNTRKILGSTRTQLIFRFLGESGSIVVLSLLLAVVWVWAFKGMGYGELVSGSLDFGKQWLVLAVTTSAALLLTLASSIYPALYITSFPMALALKGNMGKSNGNNWFRHTLVGFQFFITLTFLLCTLFLWNQYRFMMNYDMGFDKENLFTATYKGQPLHNPTIEANLKKQTAIQDVAMGDGPLVRTSRMTWGMDFKGKHVDFNCYFVSYNFLKFMGIDVIEGRDFTPSDEKSDMGTYIFNEEAKKRFDITLEDRFPAITVEDAQIAGFCEDFKFSPLRYKGGPFAFFVQGNNIFREPWYIYIRSTAGATYQDVLHAVRQTVAEFPDLDPEKVQLEFFDKELGAQYEKEEKLLRLIGLFAFLAIIISLTGIVGLLRFETNYRRKEIGIRRVHGASVMEILQLFNRRYLKILLVSFVVAAPLSYYLADYYYSTFAYRAPIHAWIFVAALAVVLLITVTVVTLCCYRAASANPAESIQQE